jgi:hypothetical protein
MDVNRLQRPVTAVLRGRRSLVRRGAIAMLALGVLLSSVPGASATVLQPALSGNVYGLTTSDELVRFRERSPLILRMKRKISGTDGQLIGIDFRPANNKLYGVSKSGAIYTIDPSSAAATKVAHMNVAIEGSTFGFDFNPNADRLRIVSDADQNLRVNVDTGATTVDGKLAYADNDRNRGRDPSVTGVGYTNPDNDPNTPTTLFDIDASLDVLTRQDPPNDGKLNTVGGLGVRADSLVGFDIRGDGTALAALKSDRGQTRLYTINLESGDARLRGRIGLREEIRGIAIPLADNADNADEDEDDDDRDDDDDDDRDDNDNQYGRWRPAW